MHSVSLHFDDGVFYITDSGDYARGSVRDNGPSVCTLAYENTFAIVIIWNCLNVSLAFYWFGVLISLLYYFGPTPLH